MSHTDDATHQPFRGPAPQVSLHPERLEDARLLFEKVLGYANHLGLYAEQTGMRGEALGNFPQAFTHLTLIASAVALTEAAGARGSTAQDR